MVNSISVASKTHFMNHNQALIDSFFISNLENLSKPLQLLANAHRNMSTILDEIAHTSRDNIFCISKVRNYAAYLRTELDQVPLAFLGYDEDIKELAETLPQIAEQLYDSLWATDQHSLSSFKNIAKQTFDINKCLEKVIMLEIYRQTEGK